MCSVDAAWAPRIINKSIEPGLNPGLKLAKQGQTKYFTILDGESRAN